MLTSSRTFLSLAVLTLPTAFLSPASPASAAPCEIVNGELVCSKDGEKPGDNNNGNGGNGGNNDPAPKNPGGGFNDDDPDNAPQNNAPVDYDAIKAIKFPIPEVMTAPADKAFVQMRTSFWVQDYIDDEGRYDIDLPIKEKGFKPVTLHAKVVFKRLDIFVTEQPKPVPCFTTGQVGGEGEGTPCEYIFKYSSAHLNKPSHRVTATLTWDIFWECIPRSACVGTGEGEIINWISNPNPVPPSAIDLPVTEIQTEAN
ncbi:hypothetical protein GCM10027589_05870 [Actinocorallia lasiicapitis]